jgi:hypothetical protein
MSFAIGVTSPKRSPMAPEVLAEFRARLAAEAAKWTTVMKGANIRPPD